MWFVKMIKTVFKMALKVVVFPVLLLMFVLKLAAELLMNIGSFAVGLVMIVFLICLGMTAYQHLWSQMFLVGLGAVGVMLVTFAATAVLFTLQEITSTLTSFVFG